MLSALVVLVAILVVTFTLVIRPEPTLIGLLALLDVVWLRVNGSMEVAILWRFTADHGLTFADLLVPATLPVALWAVLRLRRAGWSSAT
jgi:hypothetical protein